MSEQLTHEARRYCHGDDAWTEWQPCTREQAALWQASDPTFEIRERQQREGGGNG